MQTESDPDYRYCGYEPQNGKETDGFETDGGFVVGYAPSNFGCVHFEVNDGNQTNV